MMALINGWNGQPATAPEEKALANTLFSLAGKDDGHLYALVDAAGNDQVLQRLAATEANYQSLFQGSDKERLFSVGAFLVACDQDFALLQWLTTEAWGNGSVVFLTSSAYWDQLFQHLQRSLTAVTHDDREVYFRYYDPRVLRDYLPLCPPATAQRFLGPVTRMLAESEQGDALISFAVQDLGPGLPDHDPIWRQPLFLGAGHLQTFRQKALAGFKQRLLRHIGRNFTAQIQGAGMDRQALQRLVGDGLQRARMYGMRSEFDVRRYVEYMLLLSPDFDLDPAFAWAGRILFRCDLDGTRKMDHLDRAALFRLRGENA